MDIEVVWKNIVKNEGEKFYTKSGIEFVYTSLDATTIMPKNVKGSKLLPITKETIEKVIASYMPLKYPSQLQDAFYAPSYIYAILVDSRIIQMS